MHISYTCLNKYLNILSWAKLVIVLGDGLTKRGAQCRKSEGPTILCPKKRQLKQVLAYKRLVIKKGPRFWIFPQKSWYSPKKKKKSSIQFHLHSFQVIPKNRSVSPPKKGLHFNFISIFTNFFPKILVFSKKNKGLPFKFTSNSVLNPVVYDYFSSFISNCNRVNIFSQNMEELFFSFFDLTSTS